jgi:hypothetical protein
MVALVFKQYLVKVVYLVGFLVGVFLMLLLLQQQNGNGVKKNGVGLHGLIHVPIQ